MLTPTGRGLPWGGSETSSVTPTLSVAVASGQVNIAVPVPVSVVVVLSSGQVTMGSITSEEIDSTK